ncbi:hypothetical protein ACFVS7_36150, partial [Streptomyces rubiginosohelvolus]|uniref:hypothetical protein n=1 Tax=Streptomyces rubiginosohelvolus TaxID=67362 RepID=UPI0036D9B736
MPAGRGQGDGKGLIESDSPERESAKANCLEAKCETRFDRESDTKESDRVGNARQQDKEENEGKRPE